MRYEIFRKYVPSVMLEMQFSHRNLSMFPFRNHFLVYISDRHACSAESIQEEI